MKSDSSATVLIIDNDEELARAIGIRLEQAGYEIRLASSGGQGMSLFKDDQVNLVITDLNMPAGDGITVVQSIRQSSSIPIIVVTGFTDAYRQELSRLQHVTCLRKPFSIESLLELVETELALTPPPIAS